MIRGVTVDATRRTRLANERTFLAWWRTGLATVGLALATGRLLPELVEGTTWPYAALGSVFAVTGAAVTALGWLRWSAVETALAGGEEAIAPRWVMASMATVGTLSALAVVALIAVG